MFINEIHDKKQMLLELSKKLISTVRIIISLDRFFY